MSVFTFQEDSADEFNWARIDYEHSEQDDLISRQTTFDDGTVKTEGFELGVLRSLVFEDYDAFGGITAAKPWTRIEVNYDALGQLTSRHQLQDNGVNTLVQYEEGVLRNLLQEDFGADGAISAAENWHSRQTIFDAAGQRTDRIEIYDNGLQTYRGYEGGSLRQMVQTDLSADGGLKSWHTIETFYDNNQTVTAVVQTNDNGTTRVKQYENGILRIVTKEDKDANGVSTATKHWDSINIFYGVDGTIEGRETVFDNGDVMSFLYENGEKSIRLQLDGDESHPWLVRETFFGPDGRAAEINTYDTAQDVPPEYGFLTMM